MLHSSCVLNDTIKKSFSTLGVAPTVSTDELKKAFRVQAKILHPDVNPSQTATQEFQQLHDAFQRVVQWIEQETERHSARATFLTVSKSGCGSCRTISEAIQLAAPGATIVVKPGIYREGLFIDKPLKILGQGPAETIQISSMFHDCLQVRAGEVTVKDLSLSGRTNRAKKRHFGADIGGGTVLLKNCIISSEGMAGLAIHGVSTKVTVEACQLIDCHQAGLHLHGLATALVTETEIDRCGAPSIHVEGDASLILRRCRILGDQTEGIVIHHGGRCLLENSDIQGSRKSAIRIDKDGHLTMAGTNCFSR